MITACVLMEGMKVDYANELDEPTIHLTKVMPWGFAGGPVPLILKRWKTKGHNEKPLKLYNLNRHVFSNTVNTSNMYICVCFHSNTKYLIHIITIASK